MNAIVAQMLGEASLHGTREKADAKPLRATLRPVHGRFNRKQLELGTEDELEHTADRRAAERIAKGHLQKQGPPRRQDYYSRH